MANFVDCKQWFKHINMNKIMQLNGKNQITCVTLKNIDTLINLGRKFLGQIITKLTQMAMIIKLYSHKSINQMAILSF